MLPLRRLIPILCVLSLVPAQVLIADASDVTIYVDASAAGAGDGSSWADAYPHLQEAFAVLTSGEEIWIAAGTYYPDYDAGTDTRTGDISASFELRGLSTVEIYGGFPAGGGDQTFQARDPSTHTTRLAGDLAGDDDAAFSNVADNSRYVVLANSSGPHVIDGVTISGGHAVDVPDGDFPRGYDRGGGIYATNVEITVRNSVLERNAGEDGGGIYANSPLTIENSTFTGNSAEVGSGLMADQATITGSTFVDNFGEPWPNPFNSTSGGALAMNNGTILDSHFEGNTADTAGALRLNATGSLVVSSSTVIGNEAEHGGGVMVTGGSAGFVHIVSTLVGGNTATGRGGGLYLTNSDDTAVTVVNSLFTGNGADQGGAIHDDNSASADVNVVNSTLYGNTATTDTGGVWSRGGGVWIGNSILWGNTGGEIGGDTEPGDLPALSHSVIEGGQGAASATNVITDDPQLVDPDGADNTLGTADDDPTISETSPAIDAGSNAEVPADVADLDGDDDTSEALPLDWAGNLRLIDVPGAADVGTGVAPIVDIGAYEVPWTAAVDDDYETSENTQLSVGAPGVLGNDYDGDGDPVTTASLTTGVSDGTLVFNVDGSFTYHPDTDFTGSDSFAYTASDGSHTSGPAQVTITVSADNSPPTANDDDYEVAEDGSLSVPTTGVLTNDTDADGDDLVASLASSPAHGGLTFNADGSFTYVPDANWAGSDAFAYRAYDGEAYSDAALVELTVTPVNDVPTAADDEYVTAEDTMLTVSAPGLLANDTDPDNQLSATWVDDPSHGMLVLDYQGSFTYDPFDNFHGTDSFTYKAYDGDNYSPPATVTITVTPVNDAPTAGDDDGPFIIPGGTSCVDAPASLLNLTEDADGDSLTTHLYEDADHLDVTLQPDGTWCATPNGPWPGTDTFRWRAWDGQAWSNVATVHLSTNPDHEVADLTLTKTADHSSVDVGQVLTYTLRVHNAGPDPATGVAVHDGLPDNVRFDSASTGCTATDNTVVCELGTIAVGSSRSVQVRVTPTGSGQIINGAHLGYPGYDPDGDAGVSVTVQSLLPDPGFDDTDGDVFEDDIAWMWAMGITLGCNPPANTAYCPDAYVTRGQMAAFLVRALDYTDGAGDDLFDDDDTSIFERDIDRLATAGVTLGCNPPANTAYCPDAYVTRGQMAAFLVRALDYTDGAGDDLFDDDDTSIFERDIDRLATAGVTLGCNPPANTRYCPDDHVTRGQMAAFLHRALG